ncbi:class I SAM-dependent methyltransferase [Pseudomonas sp. S75]|uniref:class I SAM-dependent methyltransferase n=1 Tax=unclassified Pseudomonas TaxID=196821 RepID=UPI0019038A01|nr:MULTISPECIES: class I SAM-dependent methyltransferase [unclassified Pseudomonas]MBJ9978115.1 class I SAM-dependent methyltransferase [Pseudomonas sp. S30]MBK0155946.1 class I SAM-dependent methyltransferase [Pseudomonas sp. S75]
MSHQLEVEALFDEWAVEDGAVDMAREHWARVEPVLSTIAVSDGRYLEIGPGNGYALEYMARSKFSSGHVCAVELSREMASISARRVQDLDNVVIDIGSFQAWQAPDGMKFELIFSMEVFYYFQDISAAIQKAADLLTPAGELIVMVDYYEESEASRDWSQELGVTLTRWPQGRYLEAFKAAGLHQVTQQIQYGGVQEHGLTLCTRGKKGQPEQVGV